MFKNFFLLAIIAGLFAFGVSEVYVNGYKELADFTEIASITNILAFSLVVTMFASILNFGLLKVLKNPKIGNLLTGVIISGLSIMLMFYVRIILEQDPTFKNKTAQEMSFLFRPFLTPIMFIPALSWFTFKPLFIK